MNRLVAVSGSVLSLIILLSAVSGMAQESFPSEVSIIVGFGPGQGNDQAARPESSTLAATRISPDMSYDQTARFLARRLGQFLPGRPNVRAQLIPGAAGLAAARALAHAPPDGSVVALLSTNIIFGAALGLPGVDIPLSRLTWLGGVAPDAWACIRTARSRESARAWAGSLGPGTRADVQARALRMAGYGVNIASGYSNRFELMRALENGEIDMACGWPMSDLIRRQGEWIASEKVDIVALFSQMHHGFTKPIQSSAIVDSLFKVLAYEATMAWPLAAPPGLSERLTGHFQQALMRLPHDQQAAMDSVRAGIELNPIEGSIIARNVRALIDLDEETRNSLSVLLRPTDP